MRARKSSHTRDVCGLHASKVEEPPCLGKKLTFNGDVVVFTFSRSNACAKITTIHGDYLLVILL